MSFARVQKSRLINIIASLPLLLMSCSCFQWIYRKVKWSIKFIKWSALSLVTTKLCTTSHRDSFNADQWNCTWSQYLYTPKFQAHARCISRHEMVSYWWFTMGATHKKFRMWVKWCNLTTFTVFVYPQPGFSLWFTTKGLFQDVYSIYS